MATETLDLVRKEEEVVASRLAVLKDRKDRAKSFIDMMLDLFDTYSPTDEIVYEVGIYQLTDEVFECYVAFGLEDGVNRFDVAELQDDDGFMRLEESDPLIKKMVETNKKLEGFNSRIICLAYDYLKKEPLENFEVSKAEDKIFVLKIKEL